MSSQRHIIKEVLKGSIAWEVNLCPGDTVLKINDSAIEDVFDYHFLINDEYIEMLVKKASGEEWLVEIEKDDDEDLGITFESGLMDAYKSCSNRCIFCFIDQLPEGLRDTLYFKDDDSRLSFLQGNYITLTNMKDKDIDRIIKYKLSPINISVHTTNAALRCKMLGNRFAGKILAQIKRLYDNQITMNGQIVLCKGVNDGAELSRTIADLSSFIPYFESLSVVPMGITKFRDGLFKAEPFNKEEAGSILDIIHQFQEKFSDEYGRHFVHGGDEWYIMAEREFLEAEHYDGYVQLENGVGMMRLLIDEFAEALASHRGDLRTGHVSIATGKLAYPYIKSMTGRLNDCYPNLKIDVYCIINDFFGEGITVSGLLTGKDIVEQLKGKALGDTLLLPGNLLRSGESVLLDDMTIKDIENSLQVPIDIIKSNGDDLIEKIIKDRRR